MTDANPGAQTHSYKVGDIEIIAVADGQRTAPVDPAFVTNVPIEEVKASLNADGMPKDQFTTIFTPTVIRTAGKTIVVDTGMGAAAAAQPNATFGFLMRNLASVGIGANDVDLVVISHFHGDHVNGLLAPDGGPAFPKAQVSVPEVEWKFWMDDAEMGRAPAGRMADLFKNNRRVFGPVKDRVITHAWDKELAPGVTAIGTPGHSIGHTSYMVESKGERVFLIQDVANHPFLSLHNPHWYPWFDQDLAQSEATRRKTFDWLAAEKIPVQAFHFPFPGRARIEKTAKAYRAVPIA
jgi:glyoxylase-like metal-dependent hydrolase (beta-lactamase superfamily II)